MLKYLLQLWPTSLATQALVVGVVVGIIAYQLLKKRYKMPPGPKGLPLIGNILDITKDNMFKVFHKWSQVYGPVMTLKLASVKVVVLSRIDVVMEALVKKQAHFAGRPYLFSSTCFSEGGNDILSATYGPRWKLHRKLASKAIRLYLTGGGLNRKLSESVSIATGLMRKQKEPFDPFPYLTLAVFNILNGMCFNKLSPDTHDEEFAFYINSLDSVIKEVGNGLMEDLVAPLRLCPTPKFRRIMKHIRVLIDAIRQEITKHQETFDIGQSRDFTDSLLLAQKEAMDEEDPVLLSQITTTNIVHTMMNVFFAGIDTSRNTLHWTLLALALHPDIQKKVQEEVDSVIGADLSISVSDREHLPYTEAVLYESMRLRPVAPTGVPHETLCDTTVGGYEIPKGTMVMISHYSLHMDPDQWENVNEFRPERFLDASGKMAPKPDSWLPFSAGRRVCLGESLAKPELHLILAGIMRACSVSLPPGETHDFVPVEKLAVNTPGRYKIVVKSRI